MDILAFVKESIQSGKNKECLILSVELHCHLFDNGAVGRMPD